MIRRTYLLSVGLLFSVSILFAQGSKSLTDAEYYFSVKSYDQALPKFLEVIQKIHFFLCRLLLFGIAHLMYVRNTEGTKIRVDATTALRIRDEWLRVNANTQRNSRKED